MADSATKAFTKVKCPECNNSVDWNDLIRIQVGEGDMIRTVLKCPVKGCSTEIFLLTPLGWKEKGTGVIYVRNWSA